MMLPRRRLTSAAILSLTLFLLWYWLDIRTLAPDFIGRHATGLTYSKPAKENNLAPEQPPSRPPPPHHEAAEKPLSNAKPSEPNESEAAKSPSKQGGGDSRWDIGQHVFGSRKFAPHYPVGTVQEMSKAPAQELPKVQSSSFPDETGAQEDARLARRDKVKETFKRCWDAYKKFAWGKDELRPVSGGSHQSFGDWAATLVDSLDTLWIMDFKEEFEEGVKEAVKIDFTESKDDSLNVFEMTIRYLGGFIGAYDISEGKYPELLDKATEIGEFLLCAFDTPNRMPVTRWEWQKALEGADQKASTFSLVAEVGSLTLEFTRLSQLTGDPKFYDAVTRIMKEFRKAQDQTRLPGLWPTVINARKLEFEGQDFTLGAMADSLYEYLPKQHMLLGARGEGVEYKDMYQGAIIAAMNHVFFQPMVPDGADILMSGRVHVESEPGAEEDDRDISLQAIGEHLGCYAGGMVAIAAKLFDTPEHLYMARKLVDGCIWAYKSMPTGIMPEVFNMIPCDMNSDCKWNDTLWDNAVREKANTEKERQQKAADQPNRHEEIVPYDEMTVTELVKHFGLIKGFSDIADRRYILRPEAIESVFILYRVTGEEDLPNKAWDMFQAIENATSTSIANSAIDDVTARNGQPEKLDSMESFWTAETLKYFYLIFSDPKLVSLDKFVFTTEAHPLRRPTPGQHLSSG